MIKKLGFIGAGNMAQAILTGVLNAGLFTPNDIWMSDVDTEKLAALEGICTTTNNHDVIKNCDAVIWAVKPNVLKALMKTEKHAGKLMISIAAGVTLSAMQEAFGENAKIIRVMPNTGALVGASMSALCAGEGVAQDDLTSALAIFDAVGKTVVLPEKLFSAVTAVSGSSPAYVYMMIEAMADAGVSLGLTRDAAYMLSAQAVLGSAQMVLSTGRHPGELKDMVCSPGGTTIDAVASLENDGFRAALINAMQACAKKADDMAR